jgi:RNA polymerase sigma-70 factor (ECF subfamily)
MNNPELNTWIEGCLEGDRRAQQQVYQLMYGKMLPVCLRYTQNMDQAKDILQDGFIKVFTNIDKYNRKGSFEGWIRRVMVNTAIDYFRKSKNDWMLLGEEQSIEDYMEVEEDEETETEFEFSASEVIEAVQKLSPAYKAVFNLYVFENLQHNEIAERLEISIGTSKSNLAKAKRSLRKILLKETRKADG